MTLPHLFIVRHGQTDWNAEARLQGQEEIPLNALGRTQAARNGRHLAGLLGGSVSDYRFLASPMLRTRETMRIIRTELGLDPEAYETDTRLIELHFGDWQGSTLAEVGAQDPGAVEAREASKWTYVPPGDSAESYDLLAQRAQPVFESLAKPTIVVAHGGIVRSFLKLYAGMPAVEAAHMIIPQDRILEYRDGSVSWV
jgi:broad specificity phosphatase PhoE